MAGNGGDAQRLAALEETITRAAPISEGTDVVSRLDGAINACRALGHEGRLVDEMSAAFADHLEKLLREFHTRMAERVVELEKIMGRLGR